MTQVVRYAVRSLDAPGHYIQTTAAFVSNNENGNVLVASATQAGWTWRQVGTPVADGGAWITTGVAAVAFPAVGPRDTQITKTFVFAVGDPVGFCVANGEGPFRTIADVPFVGPNFATTPEAIAIAGESTSSQQIYAFLIAPGGAANLYAYSSVDSGGSWRLSNMGLPGDASILYFNGAPTAVKAIAVWPGSVQVFTVLEGLLWECGLTNGAVQGWLQHDSPADIAGLFSVLGVVSPTYAPPEPVHGFLPAIYVFLQDWTNNLWVRFWRDVGLLPPGIDNWQWAALPLPPQTITQIQFQSCTLCPPQSTKAYVFGVGGDDDDTLYMAHGDLESLVSGSAGSGTGGGRR